MKRLSRQYWEETSQKITWGHWFLLFNILCVILIASRYAFIIDWPETFIGKSYFFLNLFGHFPFLAFIFYLTIIFPLTFIIRKQIIFRKLAVTLSTLAITVLLFDTEVYYQFNLHLSTLFWDILINPDRGKLSAKWLFLFTLMPLILLIMMLISQWMWNHLRRLERQKWGKKFAYLFLFCFVSAHLLYAWSDAYLYRPITMQKSYLPLSKPMTARTFLEKNQLFDREQYLIKQQQQGIATTPKLDYPKANILLAQNNNEKKYNLLLINISGLRHDAISMVETPYLYQFTQQNLYFKNHYSGSNQQDPALVSLFYGLNGSYLDSILLQQLTPVWLQQTRELGYRSGLAMIQNKTALYQQSIFKNMNIDKDQFPLNHLVTQQWHEWYKGQTNQEQIDNIQQPWTYYLHYNMTGVMYNNRNLSLQARQNYYKQQLREIDKQLQQALSIIEDQLDHSIVIITSDQGYAYDKQSNQADYFNPELVKVPLLIHWPNKSAQTFDNITSHMDLAPTLMRHWLQNNHAIQDYAQGSDLFNKPKENDWVFLSNRTWNVIITNNGIQHQINREGEYFKYDENYQRLPDNKPPLTLFLNMFNRERSFIAR